MLKISVDGVMHACYSKEALEAYRQLTGELPTGSWICQDAGMVQTVRGGMTFRTTTHPNGNVVTLGPGYFRLKEGGK